MNNPYVESIKRIWESPFWKPEHVFIVEARLEKIARYFARQELKAPSWREEVFPQKDDDTFIDFLIVSGAINYCFTDFRTDKKYDVEYPKGSGKIWYGSMAMFAALKRAMDEEINVLNPLVLARLDLGETYYIFRYVSTAIPMIESRWEHLRCLGMDCAGASFAEEFRFFKLHDRLEKFIDHLALQYSRSFEDLSYWSPNGSNEEHCLEFQKRAQLVPMMYHGRALSSNGALPPLKDPENIGPIADYQVPKALRYLGVVYYSPPLAHKVDSGMIIEKDSKKEIELRAIGCVKSMLLLLERINELRPQFGLPKITMAELDNAMWHLGRNAPGRHHYTYTTAY